MQLISGRWRCCLEKVFRICCLIYSEWCICSVSCCVFHIYIKHIHIQIILQHIPHGSLHWALLVLDKKVVNEPILMDSYSCNAHRIKSDAATMAYLQFADTQQITSSFPMQKSTNIQFQSPLSNLCGIFAVAWAVRILTSPDALEVTCEFDESAMRHHVISCLMRDQ